MSKAKESHWNLEKPGGWEKYRAMTAEIKYKADNIVEDETLEIEEKMRKLDKLTDKVKFRAFGKIKPPTKSARLAIQVPSAQGMVDEQQRARELLEMQSKQIEEEINRIKSLRHGQASKIFKMKEIVAEPKKEKQDAHPVKNGKGDLVFSNEEIRKVNLEHCLETFKTRKPHRKLSW